MFLKFSGLWGRGRGFLEHEAFEKGKSLGKERERKEKEKERKEKERKERKKREREGGRDRLKEEGRFYLGLQSRGSPSQG